MAGTFGPERYVNAVLNTDGAENRIHQSNITIETYLELHDITGTLQCSHVIRFE
jgi:hypothetical protein